MNTDNILYQKQGMHVIVTILTLDQKELKVLLLKRKNKPYKDNWGLLGGAVYNNETLEEALKRELQEKTEISSVQPYLFNVYSDPKRAEETGFRMLGLGYLALVDKSKLTFAAESEKASQVEWWNVKDVPKLAYDHQKILEDAISYLNQHIYDKKILKNIFPNEVTIPELTDFIQAVLGITLDRRNLRKTLLQKEIIIDCEKLEDATGKKRAKLYRIAE